MRPARQSGRGGVGTSHSEVAQRPQCAPFCALNCRLTGLISFSLCEKAQEAAQERQEWWRVWAGEGKIAHSHPLSPPHRRLGSDRPCKRCRAPCFGGRRETGTSWRRTFPLVVERSRKGHSPAKPTRQGPDSLELAASNASAWSRRPPVGLRAGKTRGREFARVAWPAPLSRKLAKAVEESTKHLYAATAAAPSCDQYACQLCAMSC